MPRESTIPQFDAGLLTKGDTESLNGWLNEVISGGGVPEEAECAKELIKRLAEYKPI